jgi:guanine deaminase
MISSTNSHSGDEKACTIAPGQVLEASQATTEQLLRHAVELARQGVRKRAGGPFGAVIVRKLPASEHSGKQFVEILASGHNCVLKTQDPTAHAEMVVLREAAQRLKRRNLSDCELYTSCFPCAMCYGAIWWAKIPRFWYASRSEDAAGAGFDDARIYECLRGTGHADLRGEHVPIAEHHEPFEEYLDALKHGLSELY